jgi:hypothetical protein
MQCRGVQVSALPTSSNHTEKENCAAQSLTASPVPSPLHDHVERHTRVEHGLDMSSYSSAPQAVAAGDVG